MHDFRRELLLQEALQDILLASAPIADGNEQAGKAVGANGAAKDSRGDSTASGAVIRRPGIRTESDLKTTVEIQQADNGDEQADREGAMGSRFVRLVESV